MEIRYEATKELILRHIYKVNYDELARISLSISNGSRPLFWHDGVLFFFYSMPHIMNSEVSNEYLRGREHWEEVYFSEMPHFKEAIEIEEGEFKGAKIHVIRASNFTPHHQFAEWVKSNKNWMPG